MKNRTVRLPPCDATRSCRSRRFESHQLHEDDIAAPLDDDLQVSTKPGLAASRPRSASPTNIDI